MSRRWLWLIPVAVVAATWAVAAFVQTAEVRIARLPALVHAELASHGGVYLPLSSISPWVPKAAVATEDQTFWTNPGVSVEGMLRALVVDVQTLSFAQGGSTITGELVNDRILGYQKTIGRKLKEIAYSLLVAGRFPKSEVMELYLNEAYFGHRAWGIEAAAHTYFALPARDLDLAQAALTVGLLQAPSRLDPLAHLAAARTRQREVLAAMASTGVITQRQAAVAAVAPLRLVLSG